MELGRRGGDVVVETVGKDTFLELPFAVAVVEVGEVVVVAAAKEKSDRCPLI